MTKHTKRPQQAQTMTKRPDIKECEKILAEDAANVYIQDLPSFVALNKKYGGYEFYPLYVQDFAKLYIVDEQTE